MQVEIAPTAQPNENQESTLKLANNASTGNQQQLVHVPDVVQEGMVTQMSEETLSEMPEEMLPMMEEMESVLYSISFGK